MVVWLVPLCAFCLFVSMYVGGSRINLQGGSAPKEILGLLLTLVLFLAVWGALHWLTGLLLAPALSIVLPTVLMLPLLPFVVRAGFRVAGVRVSGHAAEPAVR